MENDFELIYYCRIKCEYAAERLIQKYDKLIWKIIHSFDLKHYESDLEDFYQICLYELFKSVERFSESRNVSFKTYFYKCAKTALLNHIMTENNKSYMQIKSALALDSMICEDGGRYLFESIEEEKNTIPKLLEMDIVLLESLIKEKCHPIELTIWKMRITGYHYKEIEKVLRVSNKKIDNSLRKIQRLLRQMK